MKAFKEMKRKLKRQQSKKRKTMSNYEKQFDEMPE